MAKITYARGTDFSFTHVYQINGVNATTGQKLFFTVKPAVDDDVTDALAIVKKTITMTGASNAVAIAKADIDDTHDAGNYVYDIRVQDSVLGLILLQSGVFELAVTATNRLS